MLEYAKELLAKDKQAFDKIGRDRGFKSGTDKILCVCRILREMPDVVAADRLPDVKASNKTSRAAAWRAEGVGSPTPFFFLADRADRADKMTKSVMASCG